MRGSAQDSLYGASEKSWGDLCLGLQGDKCRGHRPNPFVLPDEEDEDEREEEYEEEKEEEE